ncbi:MAG: hypothetical protein AAGB32_06405, partial [Pseudomonadota bacterium]
KTLFSKLRDYFSSDNIESLPLHKHAEAQSLIEANKDRSSVNFVLAFAGFSLAQTFYSAHAGYGAVTPEAINLISQVIFVTSGLISWRRHAILEDAEQELQLHEEYKSTDLKIAMAQPGFNPWTYKYNSGFQLN